MPNGKKRSLKLPQNRLISTLKGASVYVLIALAALIFFANLSGGVEVGQETALSQIVADIKESKIEKIQVEGDKVIASYKEASKVQSARKEPGESIYQILKNSEVDPKSVNIEIKDISWQQNWLSLLGTILPIGLMIVFFLMIFRQAKDGAQGIFSFGQSRARIFSKDSPQIKFSDVAGADEAKRELEEVVEFLKSPQKFKALGARIPKGVLMVGPSGVGKTLMARAVAGEAGVPFYSIAGSEFMEMLVGVGAARVRDMFLQAKKAAPAIIFIDEVESIGRMRGMGMSGGHDEREQTLNQILVEMDGFTPNDRVIIIAASVTGDTPILTRQNNTVSLLTIADFVDQFYAPGEEGVEKSIKDAEALGFEKTQLTNNFHKNGTYFSNSAFKKIRGVFRHKVKEIYEIEYLGGKIRATGNHSVFVRNKHGIVAKPVAEIKQGEVLVDLPLKVNRTQKQNRQIRAHKFDADFDLVLPVNQLSEKRKLQDQYFHLSLDQKGKVSQQILASQMGVSQTTVGNWQRGIFLPRALSEKYFKHRVPDFVSVTADLCYLLGLYTAEGYARKGLDFCFNKNEISLQNDLKGLMSKIFNLSPDRERNITENAINIVYYVTQLTEFFVSLCGHGAHNKHVPAFLFNAPREFFLAYFKGVILGDGYVDKRGRIEVTSVSKKLILELNWLCRMHGIKSYIHSFQTKEGRTIRGGKPLASSIAYRLGIGSHGNPFNSKFDPNNNFTTLPRIRSIKKVAFEGFVYDLCGMDNEAFFGGESPILLHNTNRPDLLDPALVRPGRFDRRVTLNLPDLEERKAIIELHMKGKPFAKDVVIERIARRTVGFSGADIANMLNEAAILAARENKSAIDFKDIEEAATKEKLGPQRKRMQSDSDRKLAAYHEAGHALVIHLLPHTDPVHRISIVSRGMAGGQTEFHPLEDRTNETKSRLTDRIAASLGGQAAEQLVFSDVSTGASSDIRVATEIAKAMVMEYGMSPLGPINLVPTAVFGGWRSMDQGEDMSPKLHEAVDVEIRKILDQGFVIASAIIKKNRVKLDKLAKKLLEVETIDGEDLEKLIGKKLKPKPV